jgi:hypothetical protein
MIRQLPLCVFEQNELGHSLRQIRPIPGRFSEGLLLRRLQSVPAKLAEEAKLLIIELWLEVAALQPAEIKRRLERAKIVTIPKRPRGLSGRTLIKVSIARATRERIKGNAYDHLRRPVEIAIRKAGKPLRPTEIWSELVWSKN